nr:MAG TPA: tail tube protein [Caudoviricetes sp.]
MANNPDSWHSPVGFHFSVAFLLEDAQVSASFSEVDGLSQEMGFGARGRKSSGNADYPKEIKVSSLVLKRALTPLDDKVAAWIRKNFNFLKNGRIVPCSKIIVSLLDENRNPIAGWECRWVIPVKWQLSPLDSSQSKIAVETLTLKYKELERIM